LRHSGKIFIAGSRTNDYVTAHLDGIFIGSHAGTLFFFGGIIMTGIAYAADPATGVAGIMGGMGQLTQFAPLILIFAVFYFLLIRPQQKQAKKLQEYLQNLKVGHKVITKGGIHGQITALTDQIVTLEIDKDVRIKVSRDAIGPAATESAAAPVKKASE
jgi:preprotein translocase subunit YajC